MDRLILPSFHPTIGKVDAGGHPSFHITKGRMMEGVTLCRMLLGGRNHSASHPRMMERLILPFMRQALSFHPTKWKGDGRDHHSFHPTKRNHDGRNQPSSHPTNGNDDGGDHPSLHLTTWKNYGRDHPSPHPPILPNGKDHPSLHPGRI